MHTSFIGCHCTHLTSCVWCNKTLAHSYSSPLSNTSHIHTLLSLLQVANKDPHFDHEAHFTSFSCPSNVLVHWKSMKNRQDWRRPKCTLLSIMLPCRRYYICVALPPTIHNSTPETVASNYPDKKFTCVPPFLLLHMQVVPSKLADASIFPHGDQDTKVLIITIIREEIPCITRTPHGGVGRPKSQGRWVWTER